MKSLSLSRMKSMRKCIGSMLAKAVLIKNMTDYRQSKWRYVQQVCIQKSFSH